MTALERLRRAGGFVLDLDGTLVLGDREARGFAPMPGAVALTALLAARGVPFAVYTNGSARGPGDYLDALRAIGLTVPDDGVLTPVSSAIDVLLARGHRRVLALGTPGGLAEPLAAAGLDPVRPGAGGAAVDAVLVGLHRGFTMDHLDHACAAVWAGAGLYSCSDARFVATTTGRALGTSRAIAGAIHAVTEVRAEPVGKPSQHAIDTAARRLGVPAEALVIVGDDPDLEIAMARRAGALGVLVGAGHSSGDADLRLDGVHALVELLEPATGGSA